MLLRKEQPMHLWRHASYIVGALGAALVTGCGSATPSGAGSADIVAQTNPLGISPVRHLNRGKSWIRPDAKKQWLIYAPDNSSGTIDIYNYRVKAGKLYGQITGLVSPYGACVDNAGNVYVVDTTTNEIYEYAHGATTPIATATDEYGTPTGCSVDPTTGNVAVSNFSGFSASGPGGIDVFAGGLSGNQTLYTNATIYHFYPPGYDPNGNLFVQGTGYSSGVHFAELPAGSNEFTMLTGLNIFFPGSVQWDGFYLAVVDQDYQGYSTTEIHRVTVSGSKVTVVRSTNLVDNCYPGGKNWMAEVEPFVSGTTSKLNTIVAGNLNCPNRYAFWNYTNGGLPKRALPRDIGPGVVYGSAVSPPSGGN
jgi:hypothetical protein